MTPQSHTRHITELMLKAAESAGATVELLDLAHMKLPFASSEYDPNDYPDLQRLNSALHASHGQIWATPEYHGSFTGAIKNALDLGWKEYQGKAVALVGTAGGQIGAIQALNHLRGVARQLHAWCLPSQISIARVALAFDESGHLHDEKIQESLQNLSLELVHWAQVFRDAPKQS